MTNRRFQIPDQLAFASLSGDFNPMHTDERAARRLLFGKPVVHGIHAVLWCINEWCQSFDQPGALRKLRADFQRPILVGSGVSYESGRGRHGETEILLRSDGRTVLRLRLDWVPTEDVPTKLGVTDALPPSTECMARDEASLQGLSGSLPLFLAEREFGKLFPRLLGILPRAQLATLLATTRIVGMECPGLHSLYSHLSLEFDPLIPSDTQASSLSYRLESVDERFHLAIMGMHGPGVRGSLRAFVRPAPRQQISFKAARSLVDPGGFCGSRAWIVGGSRGLGEVAAKLLAAGGAEVTITYHRGADDAERVASEIRQGGGVVQVQELDVLHAWDTLATLIGKENSPTELLYFATPFIAPGEAGRFSAELFNGYCQYYVHGFTGLVHTLASRGLRRVLFPSSVYVDDPPAQFAEYAAAKAAGEAACLAMENAYRGLKISKPRLPRLATDQTASLSQLDALDPAPLILATLKCWAV
jgi:acyl dehydratase